ncbi:MAG: aspartate aminotransferase family protein [Chloroflexi bacterium]|nr:aspartate aminotransferase family protein [Chloroflexota bacterium]
MTNSPPSSIYSGAAPAQVAADVAHLLDFQAEGIPLDEMEAMISTHLLPHLMRYDQPGFQSMFNAFPSAEAMLGAQTALTYNQGVTNWQVSPGGAMLEELCGQALCRLFGLGAEADATFMYSGTYGNQQALYMALHRYAERQGFNLAQKGIAGFANPERLTILIAEGAHFSLKQAVRMLGLGEDCLIQLPLDARWRVDGDKLRAVVEEIRPFRDIVCLVATAGTTSTGAVDPIAEMADVCAATGAWLHVDGAYGYAYKLVPEYAHLFAGDDRADSISWDPHKQLGAPIPNSILFVKQRADFTRMALHSHYFNRAEDSEPNPGLKSPPSTRPMSALPLTTILRGKGLNRVIEELRAPLAAMRALADYINTLPDVELCHQPDTGILCFRIIPAGKSETELNNLQNQLFTHIMSVGECSISITNLGGKSVLRLVIVTSHTTFAHLRETVSIARNRGDRFIVP